MTRREDIAAARARLDEAHAALARLEAKFDAEHSSSPRGARCEREANQEVEAADAVFRARGDVVARERELEELLAVGRVNLSARRFDVALARS